MSNFKRMNGFSWYSLRFKVLRRDNFTCQYCGQAAPNVPLEVDHKVSIADGGDSSVENLVTSCWSCNRGKSGLRQAMIRQADNIGRKTSPEQGNAQRLLALLREMECATVEQLATASGGATKSRCGVVRTTLNRLKRRNRVTKDSSGWHAL